MRIDTQIIHKALAAVLLEVTPNAHIYDNPNQQKTVLPAWFIVHNEPVGFEHALSDRIWLSFSLELVYMLEYNLPALYDEYTAVGLALSERLHVIPLEDEQGNTGKVHALETSFYPDMGGMTIALKLRFPVSIDKGEPDKIWRIDPLNIYLKGQTFSQMWRLFYTNTSHPDLPIALPPTQLVEDEGYATLASVSGIYTDGDGRKWQPIEWDLGAFGAEIGPFTEDITADLIWEEVVAPVYPEGQFVSGVLNSNPERFIGNTTAILFEAMNATDQMQVTGWTTFNESIPMNGVDQTVIPMLNGFMTRG